MASMVLGCGVFSRITGGQGLVDFKTNNSKYVYCNVAGKMKWDMNKDE